MTNEFDELIDEAEGFAAFLLDQSSLQAADIVMRQTRWLKWYREGVEAFIDIDENFPILPRSQGFAHQLDRVEEYAAQLQEGPKDE